MKRLLWLGVFLVLAACGGGGGGSSGGGSTSVSSSSSSSSSSSGSSSAALANFTAVTIDAGPPQGSGNVNVPFVTVTVCVPGTVTCQTLDHIIMDTGSIGLRIEYEALNASMRAGLPKTRLGTSGVAECYQYVDGYVFGSVRTTDFSIGGETVSDMPFLVIGDVGDYATVPAACATSGGEAHDTIADFGANGIIGIGDRVRDCDPVSGSGASNYCSTTTGNGYYYACTSGGCTQTSLATSLQIPNPVARMAVNNNGTLIVMPAVSGLGTATLTGTLYFGIGTQSNNALTAANVLTQNSNGYLVATYKGQSLNRSFIDSGTNFYGFTDSTIPQCTGNLAGFYCPVTPLSLSATLTGANGVTATVPFTIDNTDTLVHTPYYVLPGLGGDPFAFDSLNPFPSSFDFGMPFFLGRRVYTAIQGRNAGGTVGPYVAF